MINFIESFIVSIFGKNSFLATFFISMIPIVEIKGAIPFGMSEAIFGEKALSPYVAWISSSLGGLIPAFFLILLLKPILRWLKRIKMFHSLSEKLENKFKNNAEKIKNNAENSRYKNIKKYIGIIIFVAIPLPLTGVYTGSAIAVFLELGYWQSVCCMLIGNIIAGGIVVLLCTIFVGFELYVFLCFLILCILLVVIKLVSKKIKRKKI